MHCFASKEYKTARLPLLFFNYKPTHQKNILDTTTAAGNYNQHKHQKKRQATIEWVQHCVPSPNFNQRNRTAAAATARGIQHGVVIKEI